MLQVDEAKSIFTLDIYFRQYWTDKRLVFNSSQVGEIHSHSQGGAGIAWCRWTSWC